MFRKHVKKHKQHKDHIRWRGHEIGRIEAFTDAVFAFAVTLLIVSLEVPKSFDELMHDLFGFIPFGFGFLFLFWIWGMQHEFFRRYGLHDNHINILNALLIFVVLFFVYPLKFLASFVVTVIATGEFILAPKDVPKLMLVYSSAYIVIFLLLVLMYRHAIKKKDELELTESEVFETQTTIYDYTIMLSMGVVSVLLALLFPQAPVFAGVIYSLTGIPISILHRKRGKLRRLKFERPAKEEIPARPGVSLK